MFGECNCERSVLQWRLESAAFRDKQGVGFELMIEMRTPRKKY